MKAIYMRFEFKSKKIAFIVMIYVILVEKEEEVAEEGSDNVYKVVQGIGLWTPACHSGKITNILWEGIFMFYNYRTSLFPFDLTTNLFLNIICI